uniref:hypothetical protein n=1 Tax=Lactiplantibacillus plantarum TaxID=1590 RepID=UPI00165122C8|nr:hypothetical protein [Lactiplantibacillus plantarum]
MFVGSLATGTTTACMVVELLDSSGNRVSANFARADLSKLGQWQRVTVSGGTIPSGAVKVRVLYQIYGPGGNIYWSQPMISNSSNWQGYTSDTGNVVSAGEIDGSVINGSTINGTTFHGGDIISNANNTAKYYPMTITPDGAYKSTYFDSAVGLQSSVESGAISYKYRSMIGSGQYLAYDSVINGQGFESQSGYTSAKDTTFSNPETITGYVNVTPASGIYLYGPTQKINFAGNADNIGSNGITMDAYGNIYAQANSSYWRIRDINSNDIADFGIDTAGSNNIFLHRELDIGNFQINTGHTFTSADNGDIHFANGNITASSIYLVGNKNLVYNSELLGNAAGWSLNNAAYLTTTAAHDGTATLGMNNTALKNTWNTMATSKQRWRRCR